ncbi:MAG: hypothetical protein ACI835_005637 [Planctomycetota bacterium]|jgi:uncharacterized protein (TIGR01777 family)
MNQLQESQSDQTASRTTPTRSRTILVSGSSGLVGRALRRGLAARNRPSTRLVRSQNAGSDVTWDPSRGLIDGDAIDSDAVVHLAGESIAEGRWSKRKMLAIRSSRVLGTRLLAETLAALPKPPSVLVSASAIGFYGDSGDEVLRESSRTGTGFLAEVCDEWERATEPAKAAGIRVVNLRLGIVLAREGGALKKMLLPFKLGAGGRIGSGQQFMSWIHIDDLVSVICRAIDDENLSGPVNAVAPSPVRNREFTRALAKQLRRPAIAPMPALVARILFGRMANELLLASAQVQPAALLTQGFEFEYPKLESALEALLGQDS